MLLSTDGASSNTISTDLGLLVYKHTLKKKSQGNPSILKEMDNLTGADISCKVTKAVS